MADPAGDDAHVTLVPVDAADVDDLLAGRLPAALRDRRFGRGWPHDDTAAGLSFIAAGGLAWVVVDADGAIVGECGTKGAPDRGGAVEIGYGLAGPSRGRGLGTRAVRRLVDDLARRPGIRAIVAEVEASNVASRKVLERAGFTVSGADHTLVKYRRSTSGDDAGPRQVRCT
jgi:RimJ/RimL family protein N-acetyltransferase